MELDDIISLAQAADELGLAAVTLRAQAAAGRFEARNIAGLGWITTHQAVEHYRAERLGRVGRPRSPEIYARIPWPSNMYGVTDLQLGAMDPASGDERAVLEEGARTAIDLGAWTVAEVFSKVQVDPRIHDRLALGFSERPPTIVIGRGSREAEPGLLGEDERSPISQKIAKPPSEPGH
jgi:hypothetical protein